MKENKKSDRPSTPIPGRPEESGVCETSYDSTFEFTTFPSPGQAVKIADFLLPGQQNAVPLRDLVSRTGLPERDLRRQIERERRDGVLIVSDNRRGYWLAADPAEAQRFARSMLHRSREIAKTARAIEGAIPGEEVD